MCIRDRLYSVIRNSVGQIELLLSHFFNRNLQSRINDELSYHLKKLSLQLPVLIRCKGENETILSDLYARSYSEKQEYEFYKSSISLYMHLLTKTHTWRLRVNLTIKSLRQT